MNKVVILLLLFFIFFIKLNAQNCIDFHNRNCEGCGSPYQYSGQSKSTAFEKGQTSSFHITVFKNFEYCIQICSSKNLEGIYFRIIEDSPTHEVFYDSSVDDINNYLEKSFFATQTRKLIVEVIVPDDELDKTQEKYKDLMGCVGVLIEYSKPTKKGFNKE